MNDKEFHQRLNELKELWLKEFNLKSIYDIYIPNIPKEVRDYIGNQDMKITQGSFMKLLFKQRESMIAYIKPTIENPNLVLDDGAGILFVKQFVDEQRNVYFMNGEWIFSSHTRREFGNIRSKIGKSKIIVNTGFERSEVAGACDMLESGGEVSKPSHLQIKYTANQDFGTNPSEDSTKESNQSQTKPKLRKKR